MSNTSINKTSSTVVVKDNKTFSLLRWSFIAFLLVLNVSKNFIPAESLVMLSGIVTALGICLLAWLHGTKRYGLRNMAVFFAITWILSNAFEAISIQTGFPFGHYHYNTLPGPRLFQVPLLIMPSYFGMGYIAWTLSQIFNRQLGKKIKGIQIFLVPFIASFIMVMWDVVMDPIAATINKSWLWENGGNYFGVPISNYLGWFFVVYLFLQIFAIFISKNDTRESETNFNKPFWFEAIIIYGIQGLSFLLECITSNGNKEIYSSMGLVCVFTMIFVTILSATSINNSIEVSYTENKNNSMKKQSGGISM